MKVFSLDANGQIQLREAAHLPARKVGRYFTSNKEWIRIGRSMPLARLVAIWNGLGGVTPVQRFTSREKALSRIWNAIQRLESERKRKKSPPPAAVVPLKEHKASSAPVEVRKTKKAQLLALLKVGEGVSIDQLARVTGWQKHSIRGFLSGTVRGKMGLRLIVTKSENGARVYRIAL